MGRAVIVAEHPHGIICTECGRCCSGLVALIMHYEIKHPTVPVSRLRRARRA